MSVQPGFCLNLLFELYDNRGNSLVVCCVTFMIVLLVLDCVRRCGLDDGLLEPRRPRFTDHYGTMIVVQVGYLFRVITAFVIHHTTAAHYPVGHGSGFHVSGRVVHHRPANVRRERFVAERVLLGVQHCFVDERMARDR